MKKTSGVGLRVAGSSWQLDRAPVWEATLGPDLAVKKGQLGAVWTIMAWERSRQLALFWDGEARLGWAGGCPRRTGNPKHASGCLLTLDMPQAQ